jgi:hypothetical protein
MRALLLALVLVLPACGRVISRNPDPDACVHVRESKSGYDFYHCELFEGRSCIVIIDVSLNMLGLDCQKEAT